MNITKYQIQQINKNLKDIFNTFGGQSKEYMNALKQVRSNIPVNVIDKFAYKGNNYKADKPDEPLQISAGKRALEIYKDFQGDFTKLKEQQVRAGKAKQQLQKYYDDLESRGLEKTAKNVREMIELEYNFSNNSNDWYQHIMESATATNEEMGEIKDIYGELNLKGADDNWRFKAEQRIYNIYKDVKAREMMIKQHEELGTLGSIAKGFTINPNKLI